MSGGRFVLFVVVEFLLSQVDAEPEKHRGKLYSVNDSITSIAAGLLQSTIKTLTRGVEFHLYVWVYERCCLVQLPWDSPWTWVLGFLAVDVGYYVFHRASHEILLGWSFHQMHHSSEYYNFSTALRQGAVQQFMSMFFYLPAAFLVPPQVHLCHNYLNLLYQFWIHTQLVRSLGPLEWILNTPSHHRVHHGRNPYCIDKNYGGTLIIWDRLFGTFAAERDDEEIAYGLVHPVASFDQLWAQSFIFKYSLWDRPRQMHNLRHALQAPFMGPGWDPNVHPDSPEAQIPPVQEPVKRYDPVVPVWVSVYVVLHFLVPLLTFVSMSKVPSPRFQSSLSSRCLGVELTNVGDMVGHAVFITVSLQCFGMLFDNKAWAGWAEAGRVWATYAVIANGCGPLDSPVAAALHALFGVSAALWLAHALFSPSPAKQKKVD